MGISMVDMYWGYAEMCVENVGGKFFGGRHLGEMAGSGATSGKFREVAPPWGNGGKWLAN